MPISSTDPDFVTALARGLELISAFGPRTETLTIAQAAASTGLSRGTARRLLLTLEALGFVRQDGKSFALTPKALVLGYAYLSSIPLWEVAQPVMRRVVEELDQSCALGVLDGRDVVYIARTPPTHLSFLPTKPGTRMPAHVNAMGQILLAQLPEDAVDDYFRNIRLVKLTRFTLDDEEEIRKALKKAANDGYAISDRQIQTGIRSIAIAVPNRLGRPQVAINASASESQVSKHDLVKQFLPVLRRAAAEIGHAMA